MDKRAAVVLLCLAAAGTPSLARRDKAHRPPAHPAGQVAHKTGKKPEPKKTAAENTAAAVAKAYAAMPPDRRLAIEADLAWTGDYDGPPGGDFEARAIDAVKAFQKRTGGRETGILNADERARLAAAAEDAQRTVGWRLIEDPRIGARFGVPQKLVSPAGASRLGSSWASGHRQIEIETFALSEANLPALFEQEKKTPRGRQLNWSKLSADSFVILGTQGLKYFLVRAGASGGKIRGVTVLYDQATAGTMGPVAIAIADSFQAFPGPNPLPGEWRAVEYSTAIVADSRGDLIASARATSVCDALAVPDFGHAVRLAADKDGDLALLRLYGARDLTPARLIGKSAAGALTLVGIPAPALQNGGAAISRAAARVAGQTIEPAPEPGFSGAAVLDARGRFAGIAELKPATGAENIGAPAPQAILVSAKAVRTFLSAQGVGPAAGNGAIDKSIVRVICVRK